MNVTRPCAAKTFLAEHTESAEENSENTSLRSLRPLRETLNERNSDETWHLDHRILDDRRVVAAIAAGDGRHHSDQGLDNDERGRGQDRRRRRRGDYREQVHSQPHAGEDECLAPAAAA